jgi:GPH family glycoside/pentoside/hexuronide:cation symporter
MLNDAMEMDGLRTGLRREGMYSALYSFVDKFGFAVGPFLVGAALSLAGFDKTASVTAANLAHVRQATLLGVAYIPTACAVIAVTLLSLYRLDQKALTSARADSLARAAG